jgi:hypothetical protein
MERCLIILSPLLYDTVERMVFGKEKDGFYEVAADGINQTPISLTYHKLCEYKSGEIGERVSIFVKVERSIYSRISKNEP